MKIAQLQKDAADIRTALARFPLLVEQYLAATGAPQTAFGVAAVGNGGGVDFIRHLRNGRDFRRSTIDNVLGYISTADPMPITKP